VLRTHTCGEVRAADAGREVTLCGWVHTRRDHGSVTFIDLRDRYGLTQVVASRTDQAAAYAALKDVRGEWVLRVTGTVRARPEGTRNPKLPTGEVELVAQRIDVLNPSKTPPFYVNEESPVEETLRWKHRYVDLRRERSRDLMRLRHEVVAFIRSYFVERDFWEIETTNLIRSDPTGARDLVVPSRYYPGKFWALPQSPQQLKQILMVGGIDKYFQIARAYRDEDPRADRTIEHTQLDVEMSFVEREDVMALIEDLYTRVIERFSTKPLMGKPWPRLTFAEAMRRFGSDKPDLRLGVELADLTAAVTGTSFAVFGGAIAGGGVVRGIVVPGQADAPRKEIDAWTETAKRHGAKGLVHIAFAGAEARSPVAKFLSADEIARLRAASGARDGDLLLAVAGPERVASEALGRLRSELGESLGLADASRHSAVLIHEFPLVERTAEGGWTFAHNPFSGPLTPDQIALLDTDPERARSSQYDFALDGRETAGGSIRIHQRWMQERVFQQMGISKDAGQERFGALLDALEYGAPPEGGFAGGIERLCMTLAGTENIREVQAFPKTQTGYDPLLDAPASVAAPQLEELGLRVVGKPPQRS
jgi:aspartyl-tRNA synthetase